MCHEYLKARGVCAAYLYSKPDTLAFYLRQGYAACPKRSGEDFYRMFRLIRLIRPFTAGGSEIQSTEDLIAFVNSANL